MPRPARRPVRRRRRTRRRADDDRQGRLRRGLHHRRRWTVGCRPVLARVRDSDPDGEPDVVEQPDAHREPGTVRQPARRSPAGRDHRHPRPAATPPSTATPGDTDCDTDGDPDRQRPTTGGQRHWRRRPRRHRPPGTPPGARRPRAAAAPQPPAAASRPAAARAGGGSAGGGATSLVSAQQQVSQAQATLDATTLTAPQAGVVRVGQPRRRHAARQSGRRAAGDRFPGPGGRRRAGRALRPRRPDRPGHLLRAGGDQHRHRRPGTDQRHPGELDRRSLGGVLPRRCCPCRARPQGCCPACRRRWPGRRPRRSSVLAVPTTAIRSGDTGDVVLALVGGRPQTEPVSGRAVHVVPDPGGVGAVTGDRRAHRHRRVAG